MRGIAKFVPKGDNEEEIGRRIFPEHPEYKLVFYKNPSTDSSIYPLLVEVVSKEEKPDTRKMVRKLEGNPEDYESIMDEEAKNFRESLDHLENPLLTPLSDSDSPHPYEGLEEVEKTIPKTNF